MTLKNVLITLSIVAAVMVAITFYVVFVSGGGTYVVSSSSDDGGIFGTSTLGEATVTASSTASSTLISSSTTAAASSSSATSTATEPAATPGSTAIGAAPITWTQGNETLAVTGAQISGAQLTIDVQVQMGAASECVPLDMQMIADENGDLAPPITQQFTFPDTGTCTGTQGETYAAQPVVFTLPDPGTFPIILTTGGAANILFEVDQNPDGSLTVQLPPNTG